MKQRLVMLALAAGCIVLAVAGALVYLGQDRKAPEITVEDTEISYTEGGDYEELLEGVTLADGEKIPLSAMFIAEGVASSGDFAKMLGIETENGAVKVNGRCETNVPGLFAAGDCTGGLLQVAKAVGQGAVAGFEICRYLKNK